VCVGWWVVMLESLVSWRRCWRCGPAAKRAKGLGLFAGEDADVDK
jgi:hypothetical protein